MKRALFVILSAFCFLAEASAQNDSQTGYNFLRLPVSAHAAALGGDNVTMTDDDEALIFNNPALLSSVTEPQLYDLYGGGKDSQCLFQPCRR